MTGTSIWTTSTGVSPIWCRDDLRRPSSCTRFCLSMPSGTPPDKLLAAVRNFAEQEFADRHRYALALHTDEPHPHVHMEGSEHRLNIGKPMLRRWRREFARHFLPWASQQKPRGECGLGRRRGAAYTGRRRASFHDRLMRLADRSRPHTGPPRAAASGRAT